MSSISSSVPALFPHLALILVHASSPTHSVKSARGHNDKISTDSDIRTMYLELPEAEYVGCI